MKTTKKPLIVLFVIAAVFLAVMLITYQRRKKPDEIAPGSPEYIKSAEKTDGKKTSEGLRKQPKAKTYKVDISGRITSWGYERPPFHTFTVDLKAVPKSREVLQTAIVDIDGKFSFFDVKGGEYLIEVTPLDEWSSVPKYIKTAINEDISGIWLFIQKRSNISGIVVDTLSMPIEGVEIFLSTCRLPVYSPTLFDEAQRRGLYKKFVTDSDGKFSGLLYGQDFSLIARKEGYALTEYNGSHFVYKDPEEIYLRLYRSCSIQGRVVDLDGNPVPRAILLVSGDRIYMFIDRAELGPPSFILAETDENGGFKIDGLWPGDYQIFAQDRDETSASLAECRVEIGETADLETIALKPFHVISGSVVDKDGNPIEGVSISSYSKAMRRHWTRGESSGGFPSPYHGFPAPDYGFPVPEILKTEDIVSDNGGKFFIKMITEATFELHASHSNYSSSQVTVEKGQVDVRIVMSKQGGIKASVMVIDGTSGEPAPEAKVHYAYKDRKSTRFRLDDTMTDSEGFAELGFGKPGTYLFLAAKPGLMSKIEEVKFTTNDQKEVELVLTPCPSAVIKVISEATGEPISDACISLSSGSEHESTLENKMKYSVSDGYFNKETDSDGLLKIPTIARGRYEVKVMAFGYASSTQTLNIADSQNTFTVRLKKTAVVKGRVVDSDGRPISGATVDARIELSSGDYDSTYITDETDKEGSFALTVENRGSLTIYARHTRYAPGKSEPIQINSNDTVEVVEIILTHGGSISGRVTDSQSIPVCGVTMQCRTKTPSHIYYDYRSYFSGDLPTTGLEGNYRIINLAPGSYILTVDSSRHPPCLNKNVIVKEGVETTNVNFIFQEGVELSGIVIDDKGNPIEEAKIWVFSPPNSESRDGNTKSDGTFKITGLTRGKCEVFCSKEGYDTQSLTAKAPAKGFRIVLEETKKGNLIGRIISETDRKPVQNFTIKITSTVSYAGTEYPSSFTNGGYDFEKREDGSFEINDLVAGDTTITIHTEDYAPKIVAKLQINPDRTTNVGDVIVNKGVILRIHVVTELERLPVLNASVTIQDQRSSVEVYAESEEYSPQLTDDMGNCILKGMPLGKKTVTASHEQFANKSVEIEIDESGEKELTIELTKGITFRGTVISKETNTPVANAAVTLRKEHVMPYTYSRPETSEKTDETGMFKIDKLTPGTFTILIKHKDFAPFQQEIEITPEIQPQTFYLSKGGTLIVRVKDKEGQPLAGYSVDVDCTDARSFWEYGETDEAGEYRITNVPECTLSVTTSYTEMRKSLTESVTRESKSVKVPEGETVELEFIVGTGYRVYGTVKSGDEPMPFASVDIAPSRAFSGRMEGTVGHALADGNGAFSIEGLQSGKYTLMVYTPHSDQLVKTKEISITDKDLEININISTGSISGVVTDQDGESIGGANVSILPVVSEGDIGTTYRVSAAMSMYSGVMTDWEGRYRLSNVGEGEFRIYAKKDGYASGMKVVEKDEEDNIENVDIKLESPSSVSGHITTEDNGQVGRAYMLALDASGRCVKADFLAVDDSGQYIFKGLAQGQYELVLAASEYAPETKKINITSDEIEDIDFKLSKGCRLKIKVTDSNGDPAVEAVAAFEHDDPAMAFALNRMRSGSNGNTSLAADDQGVITIENLSPQTYNIRVNKEGSETEKLTVKITSRDETAEVILKEE